jgi:CubicO group peptidase (beta-lactamase class C family)
MSLERRLERCRALSRSRARPASGGLASPGDSTFRGGPFALGAGDLYSDCDWIVAIGSNTVWGLGVQFEPDGTWGMGGLGGSAGWADPVRWQAIAYVTCRLGDYAAVDRIETALAAGMS